MMPAKHSSKSRLATLDGLRALAVLGVLWIHIWTVHGNPRLVVAKVDIASVLALGGNGVDLFFVISGFCMYYFYAANKSFSYQDFGAFLKKRWIRLSPAFYTASAVYCIHKVINDSTYPFFKSALVSLAYLNAWFPAYNPEAILWSLTPEWQFYIVVPFLLIYENRAGFIKTFVAISLIFLITAIASIILLKSAADFLNSQLIFRYFEFMWGILAGKLYLSKPDLKIKYRKVCLPGGIVVCYAGRVLLSKPVLSLSPQYYNLFKLSGFTIMSLGFGAILYLALTSEGQLKRWLGNSYLSFMGKISFSIYLWHGLVHRPVCDFVMAKFTDPGGLILPAISFIISIIILIPLSAASYYLLEYNFMARNKAGKNI